MLFRAESFDSAMRLWKGMLGLNGLTLPDRHLAALTRFGFDPAAFGASASPLILNPSVLAFVWVFGLVAIAVLLPNSQQLVGLATLPGTHPTPPLPAWARGVKWRPSLPWALAASGVAVAALLNFTQMSEFLYFKF